MGKTFTKLFRSAGFAVVAALLFSAVAYAQEGKITVTGTVYDDTGEPMIGVGVLLKNTVTGTITDLDGNYTLTVDALGGGGVLVYSTLGYATQEIPVNNRTRIDVTMRFSEEILEEVVVVGYGTQKRESVVGSISTVDAKNLKVSSAQLSTGLAGQLSGVVSMNRSGEPGKNSAADFYIRGVSSFQGTVTPLVLVDGIERDIDLVDTDDIASFSILKDASASAVYGVRGANGVILITTKKGDIGRPKVNVRAETGLTQPTKLPDFVDAYTFATMANEAYYSAYESYPYTDADLEHFKSGDDPDLWPDVDWMKALYRPFASNERVNISVSGGTEVVKYFVSGSYFTESSIFRQDKSYDYDSSINYDKFNFRANVDINLTPSTVLGINMANIYEIRFAPGSDTSQIWYRAFRTSPNAFPKVYSDGTLAAPSTAGESNPYNLLVHSGYREQFWNSAQSLISLKQDFDEWVKGLNATIKFSWDATGSQSQVRSKTPRQFHASGRDADGNLVFGNPIYEGSETLSFSSSAYSYLVTYMEASLNYNRLIGNHRIGAMLLYNHKIRRNTYGWSATNSIPYKNQGIAGRVTYAYRDRYLAEFNMGYNGSENFAPGHRFGFFPAISAGYLLSEEDYWEPLKNVVNVFKLKGSYGKVGNDQISGTRWLYLSTIIDGNSFTLGKTGGDGGSGIAVGRPENLDFSWEEETKLNLGVEFEMWRSLRIQADYFRSHRTGILMTRAGLPAIAGLQNSSKLPYVNVGETMNQGVDLSLEWNKVVGDWTLSARGNFTYNRNKLVNKDEPDYEYNYMNPRGKPYGVGGSQPFGLLAIGLFQSEEEIENSPVQTFGQYRVGDIKYQDINGDGVIDSNDQIYLGYTTLPEITYGFGLTAAYKDWDFNLFFQGVDHVNFFISGNSMRQVFAATNTLEMSALQQDRYEKGWSVNNTPEENANAVYPRLSWSGNAGYHNNTQTSSWWQRNGAFMRLKNAEVGYTIPKRLVARTGFVQSFRVYLSGSNLLTFSAFDLWDVETGSGDGSTYPNNRVITLGLNANF